MNMSKQELNKALMDSYCATGKVPLWIVREIRARAELQELRELCDELLNKHKLRLVK